MSEYPEDSFEVDSDTLQLVYEENRAAHEELMREIQSFNEAAERDIQLNLVIISILLVSLTSDFAHDLSSVVQTLVVAVTILLAMSAIWIRISLLGGDYYRGTLDPHLLQVNVDLPTNRMKSVIIDGMVRTYVHNNREFSRKAIRINLGRRIQLGAMTLFVLVIVAEFVVQLF